LIVWSGVTAYIAINSFAQRAVFIESTSSRIQESLGSLRRNLSEVMDLGTELVTISSDFLSTVQEIPDTCVLKGYVGPTVKKMVHEVGFATKSIVTNVDRLHRAVYILSSKITRLLWWQLAHDVIVIVVPLIPMAIEVIATVGTMVIGLVAFYSPKPTIAERALAGLARRAPLFSVVIILSTILAGFYVHAAIVTSKFCENVDANVIGYAKNSWHGYGSRDPKDNEQTTEDLRGAARFYVSGLDSNPIEYVVTTIQSNVLTVSELRNASIAFEGLAGQFCPAVAKVNADLVAAEMIGTAEKLRQKLLPRVIYPYYDEVVHHIYCTVYPSEMFTLIGSTLLMAMLMFPVLAITLYVDLRRMVAFKRGHFGSLNDEEEDDDDESYEEDDSYSYRPAAKSSQTYTHKTPTTVVVKPKDPSGRPGRPPKAHAPRTFLA